MVSASRYESRSICGCHQRLTYSRPTVSIVQFPTWCFYWHWAAGFIRCELSFAVILAAIDLRFRSSVCEFRWFRPCSYFKRFSNRQQMKEFRRFTNTLTSHATIIYLLNADTSDIETSLLHTLLSNYAPQACITRQEYHLEGSPTSLGPQADMSGVRGPSR